MLRNNITMKAFFIHGVLLALMIRQIISVIKNERTYPTYKNIPATDFSCKNRTPGYYADLQAGCQVYHMCDPLKKQYTYLCPNHTLFNQKFMICDHWYTVNCSKAESFYHLNLKMSQTDTSSKNINSVENKPTTLPVKKNFQQNPSQNPRTGIKRKEEKKHLITFKSTPRTPLNHTARISDVTTRSTKSSSNKITQHNKASTDRLSNLSSAFKFTLPGISSFATTPSSFLSTSPAVKSTKINLSNTTRFLTPIKLSNSKPLITTPTSLIKEFTPLSKFKISSNISTLIRNPSDFLKNGFNNNIQRKFSNSPSKFKNTNVNNMPSDTLVNQDSTFIKNHDDTFHFSNNDALNIAFIIDNFRPINQFKVSNRKIISSVPDNNIDSSDENKSDKIISQPQQHLQVPAFSFFDIPPLRAPNISFLPIRFIDQKLFPRVAQEVMFTPVLMNTPIEESRKFRPITQSDFKAPQTSMMNHIDRKMFFIPSTVVEPPIDIKSVNTNQHHFSERRGRHHDQHDHMTMLFPKKALNAELSILKINPNCPECHPAFLKQNSCTPCVKIR